jgi:hypothetical protein
MQEDSGQYFGGVLGGVIVGRGAGRLNPRALSGLRENLDPTKIPLDSGMQI